MALLDSKQLNPRLTGSFILSGSTQTFIGASDFQGSVTASGDISGSYTSTGSFGTLRVVDPAGININSVGTVSGSFTSTGSFGRLETSGDALIKGNLTFGDADSDSISFGAEISSSLIPDASDAYNIGSDSKRWNDFYLSGSVSASGGPHHITSATTIDLDAEGALTLDGGSITIGGDTDVAVDIDSTTLDIDASGALTIDSATSISIGTTADKPIDIDSTTLDIDASGALTLDSATSISIGTTADKPIDIDSTTLDIDASGAITIDGTSTILISGDGGATFSDDTEALVYDGSGNVDFDTVALDIDSSGAITIDGTSTLSIDVDGTTNINTSVGNIGIDSEAGSITIDGHTGVEVTSTNSGVVTIDGKVGVTIQEDGTDVIAIDTNRDVLFSQTGGSTSDPDVEFDGYTRFDGTTEITDATNSTSTSTGALIVDGGVGIVKDLTVGGKITAEEFHTEFVSASIVFSSGSTKFGNTFDDIHQFTGSLSIGSTGENTLIDSGSISGSSVSTGSFGRLETTQANASFGGKILTLAGNLTTATGPGTIDFAAEKTLTLNENLTVSDGQDVVLTATGQTNTLTLAESFNIGDGHTGTLTFSAASKTLTVENTSVVNQDLTSDASVTFADVTADGGVSIDNITIDGTEIDLSSGDLTVDVAGDIILDADGGDVIFKDDGVPLVTLNTNTVSGSSISTGSFGSLRISSPQTLTIDNTGTVSGSAISTGSFGHINASELGSDISTLISGSTNPAAVSGSWQGVIGSGSLGMVSGSSISTGSFGYVNVAGMSIPSVSEFSSSVETRLEALSADIIALSIALG